MFHNLSSRVALLIAAMLVSLAAPAAAAGLSGVGEGAGLAGYNPNPARCYLVGYTDGYKFGPIGIPGNGGLYCDRCVSSRGGSWACMLDLPEGRLEQ